MHKKKKVLFGVLMEFKHLCKSKSKIRYEKTIVAAS